MADLMVGLAQYFAFYNEALPHQSLGYLTPDSICRSGAGGGAMIEDKYDDGKIRGHNAMNSDAGWAGARGLHPKPRPAYWSSATVFTIASNSAKTSACCCPR